MYPVAQIDNQLERHLYLGLIVSVILHLMLIWFLIQTPSHSPVTLASINVVIEPPEMSPPKRQIVSPPDIEPVPETITPRTSYLSDKDVTVPKEQIRRGDSPDAGPAPGEKSPAQNLSKPAPQKHQKSGAPLKQLRLDTGTLLDKFSQARADKEKSESKSSQDLSTYSAFSRPAGSGAAFIGLRGTSDYLPNLPDGDITLLNAKADQFAVFVRRVALQVFQQIRIAGWESLRAEDINSLVNYTTLRAVMSPQGELLRIDLMGTSGSARFDEIITAATRKGARDPNPPPEAAAEDGNVHFIFKSRSWSQFTGDPRSGAPNERRWLLLATGLG